MDGIVINNEQGQTGMYPPEKTDVPDNMPTPHIHSSSVTYTIAT